MADCKIVRLDAVRREGPARLAVELPAELAHEVETYAATHGLPRHEALRYLLEAGLLAEARAMKRDPG